MENLHTFRNKTYFYTSVTFCPFAIYTIDPGKMWIDAALLQAQKESVLSSFCNIPHTSIGLVKGSLTTLSYICTELDFPHPWSAGYVLKKRISDSGYFLLLYCSSCLIWTKVKSQLEEERLSSTPVCDSSYSWPESSYAAWAGQKESHDLDDN